MADMNFNDDIEPLTWDDFSLDISLMDEGRSYIFDETTPLKSVGDLVHNAPDYEKDTLRQMEEYENLSLSQVKRRRMLEFNNSHVGDPFLCNELDTSSFLDARDDPTLMLTEGLDPSSEGWISNCFSNGISSDNLNFSDSLDDHIDITDFCNTAETSMMQECPSPSPSPTPSPFPFPSPQIIFKGRKSFIDTPTKKTSSVAYPFALIKSVGIQQGVTLKEINQRIHTPPPKPVPPKKVEPVYPISAFSGKPVVVKTKIRTEGGKGSITIMRTKG